MVRNAVRNTSWWLIGMGSLLLVGLAYMTYTGTWFDIGF